MSEERHEIKIPAGVYLGGGIVSGPILRPFTYRINREEAQAIRDQCEKILAEKPKREELRPWDYGYEGLYKNEWWVCVGRIDDRPVVSPLKDFIGRNNCCPDTENVLVKHRRGNLRDLLAQGPIVVGLTEMQAEAVLGLRGADSTPGIDACDKVQVALARYRENQKGK